MKMPMNWAKEFAEFECTPQEFADRMTMSGSKVETYECEADGIKNVVVGKILEIVPHPDSDHMVVCQVDVGRDAPVQIVTGANNLKVGDLVPAALHVAKLPGGKEIRRGKLRGVESGGMLCSLSELGLTTHDFPNAVEDGILVLDEEWPVGTDAVKALGMDDVCVDFEITPNRPDCLAVRGLAREAAATFGVPFLDHEPQVKPGHGDVNRFLKVDIENPGLCYRYVGAVVENVRVKPSPRWMRERLRLCGVRPINNLVDITNYVMLEYGQPMHCFDYKYVNGGHITVRNALVISNPLGEDTSIMRTTALPSMMDVIARNCNARAAECALFEDTTTYTPNADPDQLPTETETLMLGAYGAGWDYLGLKGVVEKLLETARVADARFARNTAGTSYHPGRCADIWLGEDKLGTIGEVHPAVLANYGVKPRVVAAELRMDVLFAHRGGTPAFKQLPKHPAITRDLALVADDAVPAADIASRIRKAAGKALESLTLFDVYTGEHMAPGKKSLAYSLVLRAADRTLTDEEAENAVKKVLANLAEISVELRS